VSVAEIGQLFGALNARTPCGARDGAVLALLLVAGLRRSEVVALSVGDVDLGSGRVVVSSGKGAKPRVAWLSPAALSWVERWVGFRGVGAGPLVYQARGGRIQRTPVSESGVYQAVVDRCRRAGIERCTPHDLRRTCATELLDRGVDLLLVQRLLGHASPETTAIYDRRDESRQRRAVGRLPIPGVSDG